jgi:hypothetical protein
MIRRIAKQMISAARIDKPIQRNSQASRRIITITSRTAKNGFCPSADISAFGGESNYELDKGFDHPEIAMCPPSFLGIRRWEIHPEDDALGVEPAVRRGRHESDGYMSAGAMLFAVAAIACACRRSGDAVTAGGDAQD